MTHSMTAFARQQSEHEWGILAWEIRSVNHRYLEPNFRLPETLRHLEPKLRDLLRKSVTRGKIDATLKFSTALSSTPNITINRVLLQELQQANEQVTALMPSCTTPTTLDVLSWPGMIISPEQDSKVIETQALALFSASLENLLEHRLSEGEELKQLIEQRLTSISTIVTQIRTAMPDILQAQKDRLLGQFADLKMDVEPTRLEQEVVVITNKADIDEEVDRLDTHVKEVKKILTQSGSIGRRLDFLMQELNREANTLCSKSIVTDTTFGAVELKVLIEQMREQIQNIE